MQNIQEIHEQIYQYLTEKHYKDDTFRFTTRITNRFGRLDRGYWFHGNQYYLAVSFWTGTDWMNKTPNIYFCVTEQECLLVISVFDSTIKKDFVEKYVLPNMPDLFVDGRYSKRYPTSPDKDSFVITALDKFIHTDKKIIDNAVKKAQNDLGKDDNNIGFIPKNTFAKLITKIDNYRRKLVAIKRNQKIDEILQTNSDDIDLLRIVEKPFGIAKIEIKSFLGIDNCSIDDIPIDTRCIFLTGENGTGKTSILKAIGCALTNDHSRLNHIKKQDYSVRLTLSNGETDKIVNFGANLENKVVGLRVEGYAAYGPYRLMTNHSNDKLNRLDLSDYNQSLFDPSPILYDIEKGLAQLPDIEEYEKEKRKKIINAMIRDILPGFRNFIWANGIEQTKYEIGYSNSNEILDESESEFDVRKLKNDIRATVTYDQLASGAKNIISMVGDLIVRLSMQQYNVSDIGELKGFVLIDEIDIHLHPIFQKSIIQQLTDNFPEIQFIITTHSPIPLLGAPKNSVVYRVDRNRDFNIEVKRVDTYLEIINSNPNLLLTSPIFGFGNIFPSNHSISSGRMRTEDSYDEYWFTQMLDEKLNNLKTGKPSHD